MANAKFNLNKFEFSPPYQDIYDQYNEIYFGFKLPQVVVGFYKLGALEYGATFTITGAAFVSYICLNSELKKWEGVVRATLLHEMCHVKLNNRGGHGPKFKKELHRLLLKGAFDDCL